ncbi:MAG: alpha-galactosidase [Salinivirgaceae bacterium]|jgi:alpha-galactosidase|nr:alpha-galactosidase [Salinivirgaceae bacterium]
MKKHLTLLLGYILIASSVTSAQPYASWTKAELKLNNGVVERTIKLPVNKGSFITTLYKPVQGDFKYLLAENTDFQFEINNKIYSGKGNWDLKSVEKHTDSKSGDGAAVTLVSEDKKIELTVQFLLYPNLPVVRKNLVIKNLSDNTLQLESVDIEKFELSFYYASTFSWVCHDYGRRRSVGPYDGNMQDALITVHNSDWQQGIVIGNEAPGAMKHTSVFWNDLDLNIGLTHKDARFPFRKYIGKGESFTTPQVFTMVYNNHKDPDEMLNTAVPDFVRKHMGIRLSELKQKPTFVYNTWTPFGKNINEKLVMELAKAAADAGMKEFIIDEGWQDFYGDWGVDKKKFPNGLKPIFDYIKSLGMKPRLWVSVGSASPESKVYQNHPEWFVKSKDGKPFSIVIDWDKAGQENKYTACFGTGWYGYINKVIAGLIAEHGLEYLKLDFSIVSSPYRQNPAESGCYATGHSGHKDHAESLFTNYEYMWKLFDALHLLKPDLFIDCTFETMGGVQLIDYAMLKHADGNWLSNFNGPEEKIDLRIRNMAWWRSPAMPATALVIGNPEMQDDGWDLHIKSLAGALPIMLGDPRKLTAPDLKKYRGFADWLQLMENRYQIMSFRQDLPGFGEPMEGMWDGFQRMNTDTKSGGIVGVFRHGSPDIKRIVRVNFLDAEKTYQVKQMDGKVIVTQTGKELGVKGFEVPINKLYDGELFEISNQ